MAKVKAICDFLIIGAQKCGTTSLYEYLSQHPQVKAASRKEVHFFDLNYDRGLEWYRDQFPTTGRNEIAGEASPYYIFHPQVCDRVFDRLPDVKLIALLRNPVDRAISHYHHEVKLGFETLSLDAAIATETERLAGEADKLRADPSYYSFNHQHYTYLERGLYARQLRQWRSRFPANQLLILNSETFYQNSQETFDGVCDFLGISRFQLPRYTAYNSGNYEGISPQLRQQLVAYFKAPNRELYDLLGWEPCWDR